MTDLFGNPDSRNPFDAQHAQVAHLAPQIHRKFVGTIDLRCARRDLLRGKTANAVSQHIQGFTQTKIKHTKLRKEGVGSGFHRNHVEKKKWINAILHFKTSYHRRIDRCFG